jgi:23S rRNA pseudouridine2605 synthase
MRPRTPQKTSPDDKPGKSSGVRLQKLLARAGIASRRHAEDLIVAGRVRVNGRVAVELGSKADPRKDRIEVDGKRIVAEDLVYVILHKPRGVVSTMSDPEGRLSVRDYLKDVPGRVFPVGRLDYATSGVLLATNDGDFGEGLLHPKRGVSKTYIVKVDGVMDSRHLLTWGQGVELEDGKTLPAKVSLIRHEDGKTWLELTIKEGRNQQIRRMGEATGFPVMRLARSSFAGVTSEGLRPGTWRPLTTAELTALKKEYGVPKTLPVPVQQDGPPARRTRSPEPSRHTSRERTGAPPARSGRALPRSRTDDREGRAELGRGSQSRTTGTGGGPGAKQDAHGYRLTKHRSR